MGVTVSKLRVKDEDFLVASMIERCPKTMMVRELLQNAIEAAGTAPAGERRVVFSAIPIDGVPKLAIWNSGAGLTGPELYRMCDIAASIRKDTGLDRNFGMGAKVASLPSNQLGMRYRSARKGTVQEVMIGKFEGIYGRLLRPGPAGTPTEVIRVTDQAKAEGRDTEREWTEVLLMGNRAGQNTVEDPYDGQPRSVARWLPEVIGHRFFRFPEGTEVILEAGVARLAAPWRMIPLEDRLRAATEYEAVRRPDGIVLHYAFSAEDPSADTAALPESVAGVVHRNEIYGVLRGVAWRREAPSFGITAMTRHVSVMVELPDDYPVQAEAYREFLRYRNGTQAQLRMLDFAGLAAQHIPAWLKRRLTETAPSALYAEEVRDTLDDILERLEVPRRRPSSQPAPGEPRSPGPAPSGPVQRETSPALFLMRDAKELADRDLTHRAACYFAETHQLHVNLTYPAIGALAERLRAMIPPTSDPADSEDLVIRAAERAVVLRIARALAYGLSKRGQPKTWRDAHLRTVLSPESLSLAADDIDSAWPEAQADLRNALAQLPDRNIPMQAAG